MNPQETRKKPFWRRILRGVVVVAAALFLIALTARLVWGYVEAKRLNAVVAQIRAAGEPLTFKDLELDSPYNLYTHAGLPPTPVCFFHDASLEAVEKPPETGFYFFVFDWANDRLLFSGSFARHRRNAETARMNFIKKYGSRRVNKKYPGLYYENVFR